MTWSTTTRAQGGISTEPAQTHPTAEHSVAVSLLCFEWLAYLIVVMLGFFPTVGSVAEQTGPTFKRYN
jgi:hypothetical protein